MQAIHQAANGDMDIRTVLQLEQFKNHADHISGNKSKATLIGEFADCIGADTLTWEKFQFYYRAVATSTKGNDISFTQSVRSTSKLHGIFSTACCQGRLHHAWASFWTFPVSLTHDHQHQHMDSLMKHNSCCTSGLVWKHSETVHSKHEEWHWHAD